MPSPSHFLAAIAIGWLMGRCDAGSHALTRDDVLEEVRASETRLQEQLTAVSSSWKARLDAHEAQERAVARAARFDLFCIATHPRGMAAAGYRYNADWSWVACKERY